MGLTGSVRPPVDLDRIRSRVADIRAGLEVLREYAARSDQDFLGNPEAIRSARYEFIVVVEAAASICNHLCARVAKRAPSSYGECFLLLGEMGVVPEDLAVRLGKMAGFRNLLVHGYAKVDNARMLQIMRNDLGDLEQYLACVEAFLRAHHEGRAK